MMVTLGYALSVTTAVPPRTFGTAELVTLLQWATITAAVWAIAWLAIRHWLDIWREAPVADVPSAAGHPVPAVRRVGPAPMMLMNVQVGMGAAGNMLLLVAALFTLAVFHHLGPSWQQWTVAAGSPLGWIALLGCCCTCYLMRSSPDLSRRAS